ncbi:polysaccharide lyase family 8 super-sandwich domain-containing protein [Tsukamurella strandjordii]|uniref:Polysaccharide lyase family 8 super-sandwich domain-containing protein n=1 Tax=Tsukamurella strandjordii TaxID=147577 RepID=A0AA90NJD0_9ACTN|nr:polysaccharide lyase family 8 super-sandwich domain-containing protein [Tsukamurella strandjordii]MDP0400078.1 polysaccharide lyase family 8 super-sandwich domain-containing protein [Tsukamurella strandjordii]
MAAVNSPPPPECDRKNPPRVAGESRTESPADYYRFLRTVHYKIGLRSSRSGRPCSVVTFLTMPERCLQPSGSRSGQSSACIDAADVTAVVATDQRSLSMSDTQPAGDVRGTTRRNFLRAVAVAGGAVAITAGGATMASPANAATGFDGVIEGYRDILTGFNRTAAFTDLIREYDEGIASKLAQLPKMVQDLGVPAKTVSREYEMRVRIAFTELGNVAVAYGVAGSAYFQKPDHASVVAELTDKLVTVCNGIYSGANWWELEIGTSEAIATVVTMLKVFPAQIPPATSGGKTIDRDALITSAASRARYFCPNPEYRRFGNYLETGANRGAKAMIAIVCGAILGDAIYFEKGRQAFADEDSAGKDSIFKYVTQRDGFYLDGGFIQHVNVPYTGGYGVVLARMISRYVTVMSRYGAGGLNDETKKFILAMCKNSYASLIWEGRMFDSVHGRFVGNGGVVASKHWLLAGSLIGAELGSPEVLQSATASNSSLTQKGIVSLPERGHIAWAQERAAAAPAVPAVDRFVLMNSMDRAFASRSGWSFTVALSSTRIARREYGNNENAKSWYQGDGFVFLCTKADPGQFGEEFWPTVDSQLLPGTTVTSQARVPEFRENGTISPAGASPWAGGAALPEHAVGTQGMQLTNDLRTMSVRKSWFVGKTGILCLGSDLKRLNGYTGDVYTVLDNRGFAAGAAPRILVDGQPVDAPQWKEVQCTTVAIEGQVGYRFLAPRKVRVISGARTGNWAEVTKGSSTDNITRHYVTLVLVHGADGDGYEYWITPGAGTAAGLDAANIRRSAALHYGPLDPDGTTVGMHAFTAVKEVGVAEATGPCAVVITRTASGYDVSITDPTRTVGALTVTLHKFAGTGLTSSDPKIQVSGTTSLTLTCNLQGSLGMPVAARLSR